MSLLIARISSFSSLRRSFHVSSCARRPSNVSSEKKAAVAATVDAAELKRVEEMQRRLMQKSVAQKQKLVKDDHSYKRNRRLIGFGLTVVVFGIYFYTMFAVRQEHFLEDLDVPAVPDPNYQRMQRGDKLTDHMTKKAL